MSHTYGNGTNVVYQSKCCFVARQTKRQDGTLTYSLRNFEDNVSVHDILQTDLTTCTNKQVVDKCWQVFTYTKDNAVASKWVFNNILKNLKSCNNISFGPNTDNTVYSLSIGSDSWSKNAQ